MRKKLFKEQINFCIMHVAIIGGGLSGLICGKILAENGFSVSIFERNKELGGLARCFEYYGYKLPVFYHHVFSHDKVTLAVMKEVGIRNFFKKRIRMAISFDNKLYEISWLKTPFWDFLSLEDKLRFGMLAVKTKLKKDWRDLEGKNAEEWLLKEVGKNVTEKIFAPLMREKYGLDLKEISASELAMRLKEGEATGKFLYPKEGLYEMIERLKREVEKNDGVVKTNTPVTKVEISGKIAKKIKYKEKGKTKSEKVDIVINSAPVPVFLRIAKGIPNGWKRKLEKIRYCKNICVDIFCSEQISELYWINTFDKPFGGIIEHTNLANCYDFKFAWIWKYAPSRKLWSMRDEKIAKLFINHLREIFPHVRVEDFRVFRDEFASPLYDINYAKYMPEVETPIKNLFFTGVATTYPEIRTMNTAFKAGIKTAEIVMKRFL
jgi:protoporphyrinogen oxidase